MSAANYYQPHVYIDGQQLPESALLGDLTAIADLTITWGSPDWFDNIDPARLDITLLDPFGSLIATATSQLIEIRRDPDNALVFRGTIEESSSTYDRVTDTETGRSRDMWVHRIKAYDPLHQLQKDRRRGQTYNHRDLAPYRLHWGPCYMYERKNDLSARSPVPIEWQATFLDQYDDATPILVYPVPAYERQQVVSALTVLRNTARISNPLNRPVYFPDENRIRFIAATAPRTGLAPGYDPAYNIKLRSAHSEVQLLDGGEFEVDTVALTSTALEQVTRLELTMRTTRPTTFATTDPDRYMENVETSQVFDIVSDAPAQMTVQAETDHCGGFWYQEPDTSATIAAGMALGPRYGTAKLDPITYRFAKHDPAPAWALPFLNPAPPMNAARTRPLGYQFIRALTNWVTHATQFAVLGGVLSYTHRAGWQAQLTPAADGSTSNAGAGPTLGDITMYSTLGQGGDNSILADWLHLDTALYE